MSGKALRADSRPLFACMRNLISSRTKAGNLAVTRVLSRLSGVRLWALALCRPYHPSGSELHA